MNEISNSNEMQEMGDINGNHTHTHRKSSEDSDCKNLMSNMISIANHFQKLYLTKEKYKPSEKYLNNQTFLKNLKKDEKSQKGLQKNESSFSIKKSKKIKKIEHLKLKEIGRIEKAANPQSSSEEMPFFNIATEKFVKRKKNTEQRENEKDNFDHTLENDQSPYYEPDFLSQKVGRLNLKHFLSNQNKNDCSDTNSDGHGQTEGSPQLEDEKVLQKFNELSIGRRKENNNIKIENRIILLYAKKLRELNANRKKRSIRKSEERSCEITSINTSGEECMYFSNPSEYSSEFLCQGFEVEF